MLKRVGFGLRDWEANILLSVRGAVSFGGAILRDFFPDWEGHF